VEWSDLLHTRLLFRSQAVQPLPQGGVLLRLAVPESQLLQFLLHAVEAKQPRKGGEDLQTGDVHTQTTLLLIPTS